MLDFVIDYIPHLQVAAYLITSLVGVLKMAYLLRKWSTK